MNFEKRSKKNGGVEISRASDGLTTTWRCPVSSSSWSSRLADCLFNIYRPSRERGRDTHCVRVGVQRRLAGCTWRRGRDFPLFSVKFSAFMYSTGFMSYSFQLCSVYRRIIGRKMCMLGRTQSRQPYSTCIRRLHGIYVYTTAYTVYDGIYVY